MWFRYHPTNPYRPSRLDKYVQVHPGRLWLGLVLVITSGASVSNADRRILSFDRGMFATG